MSLISTLKFIAFHPLNRQHKFAAIRRFFAWQIGSRLISGAVTVPFINGTRLLVSPGMKGATGNIYVGLHEFEDMAFLLHFLRPADLFADIGANIGTYTILASGAVGAHSLCFEPLPSTWRFLRDNINLNAINDRVVAHNLGIGKEDTLLYFTEGLDTVNHVATDTDMTDMPTCEVKVVRLDNIVGNRCPKLIKIDVEGYETNVIAGAEKILENPGLEAVILELNGSGNRYGFDETAVHQRMLDFGFTTWIYDPLKRKLIALGGQNRMAGNTLYLRNLASVRERVISATSFRVLGQYV